MSDGTGNTLIVLFVLSVAAATLFVRAPHLFLSTRSTVAAATLLVRDPSLLHAETDKYSRAHRGGDSRKIKK